MEETLPSSSRRRIHAGIDGEGIKKLRNELNLSQEQFAQFLSVSAKTIARWENNKSVPAGANLQNLQNLREVMSRGGEWREAILSTLSSRGGIAAAAGILSPLNALFIMQTPQTSVTEIFRKLLEGDNASNNEYALPEKRA